MRLQAASANPYFRPYTNHDVIGCELGGAIKNIIAILVGMAEGMGFGDNTRASIITRGLAETARLGVALGADAADLRRTGRSRRPGRHVRLAAVAQPHLRRAARAGPHARGGARRARAQVVEGVATSRAVLELARRTGVDMPIAEHVVRAVSGEMAPAEVLRSLMARERKSERTVWRREPAQKRSIRARSGAGRAGAAGPAREHVRRRFRAGAGGSARRHPRGLLVRPHRQPDRRCLRRCRRALEESPARCRGSGRRSPAEWRRSPPRCSLC